MNNSAVSIVPFEFQGHQVRVLLVDGQEEWVAKDVCDVLEHSNSRVALADVDADEKGVRIVYTPGGPQEMTTVREPGLYKLIMRSRKPNAKVFARFVCHEVLPSIRAKGYYASPAVETRFERIVAELDELRTRNIDLSNRLALLSERVAANDRPFGLLGKDAPVLRRQIKAVAYRRIQQGDNRPILVVYTNVDDEVRAAVAYPRRAGATWERCTSDQGSRAFSFIAQRGAALERAVRKSKHSQLVLFPGGDSKGCPEC